MGVCVYVPQREKERRGCSHIHMSHLFSSIYFRCAIISLYLPLHNYTDSPHHSTAVHQTRTLNLMVTPQGNFKSMKKLSSSSPASRIIDSGASICSNAFARRRRTEPQRQWGPPSYLPKVFLISCTYAQTQQSVWYILEFQLRQNVFRRVFIDIFA